MDYRKSNSCDVYPVKPRIILISGQARHGKDTVAKMIKERLQADGHEVLTTHFADLLKYICRTFLGWNGEKDADGRRMLQTVGTDVIKAVKPDYWVDFISDILSFFPESWEYVLIPDTRFPNEIDKLRDRGFDVIHLRVVRAGYDNGLKDKQGMHASETALEHVQPDIQIDNAGGLNELRENITKWIVEDLYEKR